MNREMIEALRERYPKGTRIELIEMPDDPYPVAPGTIGTCRGVDDAGQIMMSWDTGGSLSLIPGVDSFRKVAKHE